MSNATAFPSAETAKPRLVVGRTSRHIPQNVPLLNQWQYGERAIHRLIAAWGRQMVEWDGKAALHRQIWDQAEIIRRMRDRISQFPGGKPDAPVSGAFARVADAAVRAPSFEDALDGIYKLILPALTKAYVDYTQHAHPVHDAPSLALFHEINTLKAQHYSWYRAYRRRHPHQTNAVYAAAVLGALADAGNFLEVLPVNEADKTTLPCPPDSNFFLPAISFREKGWSPKFNLYPYFSADFSHDIEARRLFWGVAYTQEMNLPDDQLAWLYYADWMPWDWHYDISRHLWDESRHGCSGHSRLQDWGISIQDVGFVPYNRELLLRHPEGISLQKSIIQPWKPEDQVDFTAAKTPMTKADMYEVVFLTGMVAETGHFSVKNEGYNDFREAEDLDSAEMMLFDIIDETAHVQYAHRWLPLLAGHAGIDNTGYRERAVDERNQRQAAEMKIVEEAKTLPRDLSYAPYAHYQYLLEKVRQACPINETEKFTNRSYRPM